MERKLKVILSVLAVLVLLFVATLFYKTLCVMFLVAVWQQVVGSRMPEQWRRWSLRGMWCMLALTLWIAMPRYRIDSSDRVRLLYLNGNGEPVHPPLLQYALATLLPEEEIVNVGLKGISITAPFLRYLGVGNSLIRQVKEDIAYGRGDNFLTPYQRLWPDNPMSGCYAQVFNDKLNTNYQVVFLCRPKHYDASKRYPLIVFCHGYLGNCQLYQGVWSDFDNAIVLSIGTQGMNGIFSQTHINQIFSFYLPMLEKQGFHIDRSQLHLIGLSNGGTAVTAAMHSRHADDFRSVSTVSCNLGSLRRVPFQVNFIGGGKDNSANDEPAECRRLQRMGVDADIFFHLNENHFILLNHREEIISFLKRRMNLKETEI